MLSTPLKERLGIEKKSSLRERLSASPAFQTAVRFPGELGGGIKEKIGQFFPSEVERENSPTFQTLKAFPDAFLETLKTNVKKSLEQFDSSKLIQGYDEQDKPIINKDEFEKLAHTVITSSLSAGDYTKIIGAGAKGLSIPQIIKNKTLGMEKQYAEGGLIKLNQILPESAAKRMIEDVAYDLGKNKDLFLQAINPVGITAKQILETAMKFLK